MDIVHKDNFFLQFLQFRNLANNVHLMILTGQTSVKVHMNKCTTVAVAVKTKLVHREECFQVFAILDERTSAGEA